MGNKTLVSPIPGEHLTARPTRYLTAVTQHYDDLCFTYVLNIINTISSVSGRQLGVHGHIDTIHLAVTYNEGSVMYIEGARHSGFNAFTQLKFHMI